MRTVAQWIGRHQFFTTMVIAVTALGGGAALSTTATEEPATRTGCTIDAINEPPGVRRDTLVKTSCGGLRSPNRTVTDRLQVGGT
ncbi:hypothetical protein [Rhodococcus sp. AG1013]|nr:hypothetical protein [Rhodococcus sp. AG1013]RDI23245.1 hypothetical protein DEU38_112109 [Rhodococcus sp. AG1013]